MAANIWSSAASTDGNNVANWSLGALNATDTLTYNATSVVNCTFTAGVTCAAISVAATYSGALSQGGQTITSSGAITIDGTGNLTLDAALSSGGSFHIGSGIGTLTCTSCALIMSATGNLDIDKSMTSSPLQSITISGGNTTHTGAVNLRFKKITINNSCAFYPGVVNEAELLLDNTVATPFTNNGTLGNTSADTQYFCFCMTTGYTFTVPAITAYCQIHFENEDTNAGEFDLGGNITAGNFYDSFSITVSKQSTGALIFDTKNYNLTCAGNGQIRFENFNTSDLTTLFGSSAIACIAVSFNALAGNIAFTMNTSAWTVSGSWTFTAGVTVTPGTSTVTIHATGTITSAGKSFYTFNCDAGTTTLADALIANTLTTSSTNVFDSGTKAITTSGAISFGGSGNLTLTSSTITITGDANFSIASGVGTLAQTSTNYDFQGTGAVTISKTGTGAYIGGTVTCVYNGKTTTMGSNLTVLGIFTCNHSGGTLAMAGYSLSLRTSASSTPFVRNACTITGTSSSVFVFNTINCTVTIALGTVPGRVYLYPISGTVIFNFSGAHNFYVLYTHSYGSTTITVNTNDVGLTIAGGAADIDASSASDSWTWNFGNSAIAMYGLFYKHASATVQLNMSTSQWTCAGNLSFGTVLISAGTSSHAFTASATITSSTNAGNACFYTITCTAGTTTLGANLICNTITTSGTNAFTAATFTVTSVGTQNYSGSGALTLANTCTVTGNGDFTIGAVGTLTLAGSSLDVKGTGAIDITKAFSFGSQFVNITCGYNGKTTTVTNRGNIIYWSGILTVASGGTLTINQSLINVNGYTTATQANPLSIGATAVLNGGGTLQIRDYAASGAVNINIPALALTGNSNQYLVLVKSGGTGVTTFTLTGAISSGGENIIYNNVATGTMVFDTGAVGNYGVTGLGMKIGSNSASASTFNFNASVINCGGAGFSTYNTGVHTINAGTSTWTIGTTFVLGSNAVWNNGTSITFNGAAAGGITTPTLASQILPAVTVNKTGTFTLSSAISVASFTVAAVTTFSSATFAITSAGSILLNGGTTFTLTSSTITISGDGAFHADSTITTLTVASTNLVLQGTGNLELNKSSVVFLNLTIAAASQITTWAGTGSGCGWGGNGQLTLGTGTLTFAVSSSNLTGVAVTNTTPVVNAGTLAINGSAYSISIDCVTDAATYSIASFAFTGSAGVTILKSAGTGKTTINMTGHMTGSGNCIISNQGGSGSEVEFNTSVSAYSLFGGSGGVGYLAIGASGTGRILTFNAGASTIAIGGYYRGNLYTTGTTTINLQTATITCTGNWINGSTHTMTYSVGCTILFNTATATALTCATKAMPPITINKTGTFTLMDAITSVKSLTVTNVDVFLSTAFNITSTGSILLNGGTTFTFTSMTITITGDGDFHADSTITTLTVASTNLVLQGTGNLDLDKNDARFNNLTIANTGKVTTVTGSGLRVGCAGTLILGTGTLTLNGDLYLYITGASGPLSNAGATVNGTNVLYLYFNDTNPNADITIPTLTMTGTSTLDVSKANTGPCGFTLAGHVSAPTVKIHNENATNSFVFDTSTFNLTASTGLSIGGNIASSTSTFNFNASTISVGTLNATLYNTGTITFALMTSQWTVSGATFVLGSNHTLTFTGNPTAAKMVFTGADPVLTVAGKTLPWVDMNISGSIMTFNSSADYSLNRFTITSKGKETDFQAGKRMTVTQYTTGDWNGT